MEADNLMSPSWIVTDPRPQFRLPRLRTLPRTLVMIRGQVLTRMWDPAEQKALSTCLSVCLPTVQNSAENPAGTHTWWGFLLGLYMATFLSWARRALPWCKWRKRSLSLLIKALIPSWRLYFYELITSQRPHLKSHHIVDWGFNIQIWRKNKDSVYSNHLNL